MAEFDPDAYLAATGATKPGFDPDAYLVGKPSVESAVKPKKGGWEGLKRGAAEVWENPSTAGVGPFQVPGLIGMAKDVWGLIKAPGEAYRGELDPLSDEGIGKITDAARAVMTGTLGNPRFPAGGTARPNAPTSPLVPDALRVMTKPGREAMAERTLRDAADDPNAAVTALRTPAELVPDSAPTTFQQSGDMGLGNLERAAAAKAPNEFLTRRAEQNAARVRALEDIQKTGSPEDVAEFLRSAQREIETETATRTKQTEYDAWRAAHELGDDVEPVVLGNRTRHELSAAEQQTRQAEGRKWDAVDPEGNVMAPSLPLRNAARETYEGLSAAEKAGVSAAERDVQGVLDQFAPTVSLKEVADLRSLISEKMRQELKENGRTKAYGRLSKLRGQIEETVNNRLFDAATGTMVPEVAERLAAASAATKERAGRFGTRPIKDIIRREGLEGPYVMQEGAVPGKIFTSGATGYDNVGAFRRAVGDTEAAPILLDSAVASMRKAAMRDGQVDPARLESWVRQHETALRAIEETEGGRGFTQRLRNAGDAARVVSEVAASRRAVADEAARGVFGKLAGATDKEDISRIIGSIFGGESRVAEARGLARKLGNNKDAMEGARMAIVDHVLTRFISETEGATTSQNLIRANEFLKFVRQNKTALEQFFPEPQLNQWLRIGEDLQRSNRSVSSTKLPGQSNTPQDFMALEKSGWKPNTLTKISMYATAAMAGMVTGGGSLMSHPVAAIAGALAAAPVIALRDAGIVKFHDLMAQAMLNPELAARLMTRTFEKARGFHAGTMIPANVTATLERMSMFGGDDDRRSGLNWGQYLPSGSVRQREQGELRI